MRSPQNKKSRIFPPDVILLARLIFYAGKRPKAGEIMQIFLGFTIKDWLIIVTLIILGFCILEIRRLKKQILQETQRRLIPQLNLEFNFDISSKDKGFYLKNESLFLARDIKIEDADVVIDDVGFTKGIILRFEGIDILKPQERVKLKFNVLDKRQDAILAEAEDIILHLCGPSFKVVVLYSNIENLKFRAAFVKTKERFYLETIDVL